MNKCKYNTGFLEGKPIYCNKEIKKVYEYCYGHHLRIKKEDRGYASTKDATESGDINF